MDAIYNGNSASLVCVGKVSCLRPVILSPEPPSIAAYILSYRLTQRFFKWNQTDALTNSNRLWNLSVMSEQLCIAQVTESMQFLTLPSVIAPHGCNDYNPKSILILVVKLNFIFSEVKMLNTYSILCCAFGISSHSKCHRSGRMGIVIMFL